MLVETDTLSLKASLWLVISTWLRMVIERLDKLFKKAPKPKRIDCQMPCLGCEHPEVEHELHGYMQEDPEVAVFACKHPDCDCTVAQREKPV